MTRAARGLAVVVAVVAATMTVATPAGATAYRYWSYWTWTDGTWQYSTHSPSGSLSAGDVIGWRFAVQTDSSHALAPRVGAPHCDTATQIGVTIDYGTNQDAPPGEHPPSPDLQQTCVPASNNTGYKATDAAAPIRTDDSGLVCGIDGYPAHECAPIVSATQSPTATARAAPLAATRSDAPRQQSAPRPVITPAHGQRTKPAVAPSSSAPHDNVTASPSPTLPVATAAPAAAEGHGSSSLPWAWLTGLVLAAALGGVAFWRYRAGPR